MSSLATMLNEKLPLPKTMKETLLLRAFGFFKIPMLFFVGPKVVELSDEKTIIKIPLNYRTKNHLGAMYFGVLCAGADCAGGLAAMRMIEASGRSIALVFKDFKAEFLKRAHGDVIFVCNQGLEIKQLVEKSLISKEREELPLQLEAFCPEKLGEQPVARFVLTLSLKLKE